VTTANIVRINRKHFFIVRSPFEFEVGGETVKYCYKTVDAREAVLVVNGEEQ
jgi:hypothetical protein